MNNYNGMKKDILINKIMEKDEYIVKVELMLKKANEAKKAAEDALAVANEELKSTLGLRSLAQAQEKQIKELQVQLNQPKPVNVLENMIKDKEAIIKKLSGFIDSYIGATQEVTSVLRGVVNMSDNAYKNILEEIKKG